MYARVISSRVSVHEKSPKTDNICDLEILVGYVSVRPSRLIFQIDNSDFNYSQLSAVYRRLQVIIGPLSLPFINSIFVWPLLQSQPIDLPSTSTNKNIQRKL